jgi:adenylate kinase
VTKPTVKVVTVFGLSGVGKSWMISRCAAAADVAHIHASQLMREARAARVGRSVISEDLRRGPVLDNQILLTDPFAKVLATESRPIIFDGHCLVDVGEQPIEIPVDVIRRLQPSGIMIVHAPADEIVKRRNSDISRERPVRMPTHWQPSRIGALPYAPIMLRSWGSDSCKCVLATSAALPNL